MSAGLGSSAVLQFTAAVHLDLYVGRDDDTIALYHVDPSTGTLSFAASVATGRHPSFLAFAPEKNLAYAVNEFSAELAAFRVDPASGALSPLNRVSSQGETPAFISLDATRRFVLASNYDGGNVAVFRLEDDGRIGAPTDARATGHLPHTIRHDPAGRFVLVTNKGSDTISIFELDTTTGKLRPARQPELALPKGTEPRHVEFGHGVVYVITEAGSEILTLAMDPSTGVLSPRATVSTLPPDARVSNTGADIHLAPSGRFLYGSNRGHDSIVILAADEAGEVRVIGHEPTRGKTPRNFALDPSGSFLFAANQDSGTIATFRIDGERGTLRHLATTPVGAGAYWVGMNA